MRGWVWAAIVLVSASGAWAQSPCPAGEGEVVAGGQTFQVELASTADQRQQGLSKRPSLAAGHGLWFDMGESGWHGFWMKDMRFAIDLVWLSERREVLGVNRLEPCGAGHCPVHYPPAPARYVLEVNAGEFHARPGTALDWRCRQR